ncbi:nitroreductase family protein [Sulfurirhabdus autotrophica]|nr:molybdopterin biosynthesis protein MoeY [Sulfurirhabdus autotrophica]
MSGKLEAILELARWAPSGDNTQPWRFEKVSDNHLVVHGFDTRDHCVYDLDGHPSQIAIGALLETIAIAASGQGLTAIFQRRLNLPETTPTIDVQFELNSQLKPNELIPYITQRSVQRRPLHMRRLSPIEKNALEAAAGNDFQIFWIEGFSNKLSTAKLMFANAKLRLTIPEAYEVHRSVIQWNSQYSEDKVPDQAVGLDPLTLRLMRWVMQSWQRVSFFNRYLAGTLAPRLQLDLIPGIACAAHFALIARQEPESIDDYISAGRALQRFWLTATKLDLQLQPEMTPLIFAAYTRQKIQFSQTSGAMETAISLAKQLKNLLGNSTRRAVFMGRIGAGLAPKARSLRLAPNRLRKN